MRALKKPLKNWNGSNLNWTLNMNLLNKTKKPLTECYLKWSQWRVPMFMMRFQFKTVLKRTSTMRWMVLGSNEGRLPLNKGPGLGWCFCKRPETGHTESAFCWWIFTMLDCNYLWYQYCVSSCTFDWTYWWKQVNTIQLETACGFWNKPCTGWSRRPNCGRHALPRWRLNLLEIRRCKTCVVCVINWFVKPLNGQRSSLRKSYWRLKANWNLKPL